MNINNKSLYCYSVYEDINVGSYKADYDMDKCESFVTPTLLKKYVNSLIDKGKSFMINKEPVTDDLFEDIKDAEPS